jgi:hypothetical protein
MYLAKFKNTQSGEFQIIRADEYDRKTHGVDLICGDADCHAPMTFRQGGRTHGESFIRAAHFSTMPKREHREGCTLKTLLDESEADGQSFIDAVRMGQLVVINLNLDLGAGLNVEFKNAARFKSMNTEYGRFARDYADQYVTRSVKSLPEMLEQIRAVETLGGKAALNRIWISHQQSMRKLDDILIRNDEQKLKTLYHNMFFEKDKLAVLPDRVVGFPRLFHFVPTKKTREDEKAKRMLGNSMTVAGSADSRLVLLQGISTRETSLKGRVLEECEIYILACPAIHPYAARQASMDFKKATKDINFIFMDWNLRGEGQFMSVPDSERKMKLTLRDRQPGLDL